MPFSFPEVVIQRRYVTDSDLGEFDDHEAAAIRAGDRHVYDISVIEARTDESWGQARKWKFLETSFRYLGTPGCAYIYDNPRQIPDEALYYYATDMWAYHCGIKPGDLVRHRGVVHCVMEREHVDQDYGSVGFATGYFTCQPMTGGYLRSLWAGDLTPVRMLTAPQSEGAQ